MDEKIFQELIATLSSIIPMSVKDMWMWMCVWRMWMKGFDTKMRWVLCYVCKVVQNEKQLKEIWHIYWAKDDVFSGKEELLLWCCHFHYPGHCLALSHSEGNVFSSNSFQSKTQEKLATIKTCFLYSSHPQSILQLKINYSYGRKSDKSVDWRAKWMVYGMVFLFLECGLNMNGE